MIQSFNVMEEQTEQVVDKNFNFVAKDLEPSIMWQKLQVETHSGANFS